MVVRGHDIPGESLGEALSSVTKSDALSPVEFAELVQVRSELIDRFLIALTGAVEHKGSVLKRIRNVTFHVRAEAAEIGCYGWKAERKTLKWCVSPWLVVARK
jgi:hypothetical protein